ncbi:MAG: family 10 glycosylhydrolase [Pyrinomonadaceae bacterium]|nr:family 10 glycosylhydrolase [Pyrinomonadaceae bacterium]
MSSLKRSLSLISIFKLRCAIRPPSWKAITFALQVLLLCLWLAVPAVTAQSEGTQSARPEYRAYWVDTFNSALGTRADIDRVVDSAVQSNANGIFAQVRRRGDSWYLNSKEPLTQVAGVGEPDASGKPTIDPLKYLVEQAHARGIEVHAYVIVGTIYNAHPTITGLPRDERHVFNQHFWDKTTNALLPDTDPRQWSTRSLPHNTDGTTFNGHRYAAEWYVDLGHPDAAAYTADVLTHLVANYNIDGIHLDRIRYPEAPIDRPAGQSLGINTGYNETSVQRFKARYGDSATYYQTSDIGTNVGTTAAPRLITAADVGYPRTNDPLWNQWRRDQVTNFVRRLYLNATAVNPKIKVSAALICFFTGPTASGGWEKTEAYYRVFQDWRAWTEEGTLDIIAPMIYKQEHISSVRAQYDDWLAFTKELARSNNRHSMPGLGVYLNAIEGSLRQARRALARPPYETTNAPAADGVIFYALGNATPGNLSGNNTNVALNPNPFSYPVPNQSTPKRTNADFFAALRTGASANGTIRFEDPALEPLFPSYVPVPDMPWKSAPTTGYAMGFVKRDDGTAADGAAVTIENVDTGETRPTTTDGGGFYGMLNLAPGTYRATAQLGDETFYTKIFSITPGVVATADARTDNSAPVTVATINPSAPNGANGWYTSDVSVTLAASDDLSGIARTEYSTDGGATWQTYSSSLVVNTEGITSISYRSVDRAGNEEAAQSLTLKIDKTAPSVTLTANPSTISPPNGKMIDVIISGSATDAVSGLSGVTYVVTDEYGMPLSIAPRTLEGNSATWTETLRVEARRNGNDKDGRRYLVTATVSDRAGNTSTASTEIVVRHDNGK